MARTITTYGVFVKEVVANAFTILGGGTAFEAIGGAANKEKTEAEAAPSEAKSLQGKEKGKQLTLKYKAPAVAAGEVVVGLTVHVYCKISAEGKGLLIKLGALAAKTSEPTMTVASKWVTLVLTAAEAEAIIAGELESASLLTLEGLTAKTVNIYEVYISLETETEVTTATQANSGSQATTSPVGGGTISKAITAPVVGNALLVAVFAAAGEGATSVADNEGNTYTKDGEQSNGATDTVQIWRAKIVKAPTELKVTFAVSAAKVSWTASEFSPLASAEVSAGGTGVGAVASAGPTAAVGKNGDMIFAAFASTAAGSYTASSYTIAAVIEQAGLMGAATYLRKPTEGATQTANATTKLEGINSSGTWAALIIAYHVLSRIDLTVSQPQSVSKAVAIAKKMPVSQPQATQFGPHTLTRALAVSQPQSASKSASIARVMSASQAQAATIARVLARVMTLSISQAVSVVKAAAITRALSTSQGQAASKAAAMTRALALEQGQSASERAAIGKTLSLVQAQAASKTASVARSLFKEQGQTLNFVRGIGRTLSFGQPQEVFRAEAMTRHLAAEQGQSATIRASSITHHLLAEQAQSATKGVALTRTLAVSQAQSATKRVALTRTLVLSQAQLAVLQEEIESGEHEIVFTVSQGQVVTIRRALARKLTVSQGQAVARTASIARHLTVAITQQASKSASITRALKASQGQAAATSKLLTRTLSSSQPQEASQTVAHPALEGTFTVTQGQAITMHRTPGRHLTGTQASAASAKRAVSRHLSATQPTSVVFGRVLKRKLTVSQGSATALPKAIGKIFPTIVVSSLIVGGEVERILGVAQESSATLEGKLAFHPGRLSSSVSWTILTSDAETSIVSSVEPVVLAKSGVE